METDQLSRKLAVILHADVVGSTSLVQKDEALAHQRIRSVFNGFSETIGSYGGLTREIRGDALVAQFERASDAVSASLKFQKLNAELNLDLKDQIRPELRIGISLGEVIVADNTMTGEGVVLAQRLEQLAEPGGIVVQGTVSETVPTRMPFQFESLGEQLLKGFDQPVRAFSVKLESGRELPSPEKYSDSHTAEPTDFQANLEHLPESYEAWTGERLELPDKPSIAVLPFQNMSGDSEQEYFADGMSEDIIAALSRVPNLIVIARNSTFVYKGRAVDIRQVGKELGVGHVLEGSIRKSGDRLRITAQLINTQTGDHVWAERYDRNLNDFFTIQDEITHKIVVELQIKLITGQDSRLLATGTPNIEAWGLVMRAGPLVESHARDNAISGKLLLNQALKLDKNYSSALVLLGWIYWEEAAWGWSTDREKSIQLGFEAVEHSLSADPGFPDAYSLLGAFCKLTGDVGKSIAMNEKAFELAPSDSGVIAQLGSAMIDSGQVKEGLKKLHKALRLCPFPPAWYLGVLGRGHHLNGDNEIAISILEKAVQREPNSHLHRVWLTSALFESERFDEAYSVSESVISIEPAFSIDAWAEKFNSDKYTRIKKNLLAAGLPK